MSHNTRAIYIVPAAGGRHQASRPIIRSGLTSGGPAILNRSSFNNGVAVNRSSLAFRPIAAPISTARPPKKQFLVTDDHIYAGPARQQTTIVPRAEPPSRVIQCKKRRLMALNDDDTETYRERHSDPTTTTKEAFEIVDIAEVYTLLGEHFGPENSEPPTPRKRERLTNLTKEEKLHRRKLKNRVAAQTARDRKKERSIKLEKAVRALLHETSILRAQNVSLQREVEQLKKTQQRNVDASSNSTNLVSPSSQIYLPEVIMTEEGEGESLYKQEMGAAAGVTKVENKDAFESAVRTGVRSLRHGYQPVDTTHQQPRRFAPLSHHQPPTVASKGGRKEVSHQENDLLAEHSFGDDIAFYAESRVDGGGGAEDEDRELEAIFDDLFGNNADQQTIEQFCNQVIEDEIANEIAAASASPSCDSPLSEVASTETLSLTSSPTNYEQTMLMPTQSSSNCATSSPDNCWLASPDYPATASATADVYTDNEDIFIEDGSEDVLFAVHEEEPLELLVEDNYEEESTWSDDGANIGCSDMQMEHETCGGGGFDKYDLFSENFDCGGEYASVENYGLVL